MPKIQLNNVELYYEEHGAGARPIIFVHGFLLSSTMWQGFYIARLPEPYRAYAIDIRGHGQSHHIKQGCNLVQLGVQTLVMIGDKDNVLPFAMQH